MGVFGQKTVFNDNPDIAVTHQEIADELGTSREVVSRILKDFEKMGQIKMGRSKITLLKR